MLATIKYHEILDAFVLIFRYNLALICKQIGIFTFSIRHRNCFDFMLHKIYDGFFSETRQILQT